MDGSDMDLENLARLHIGLVIDEYFDCKVEKSALGVGYLDKDKGSYEWLDAVVECDDRLFFLEVREFPDEKDIREFKERVERFVQLSPQYKNKKPILIMASSTFSKDFVKLLSQAGIYAMAYREWEYMDILNFEEVNVQDS